MANPLIGEDKFNFLRNAFIVALLLVCLLILFLWSKPRITNVEMTNPLGVAGSDGIIVTQDPQGNFTVQLGIKCENGEIIKWDDNLERWVCNSDAIGSSIIPPTCTGTDKLVWTGSAYACATDITGIASEIPPICNSNEKLLWNGSDYYCDLDQDTIGGGVTPPSCLITEKLLWNGVAYVCISDALGSDNQTLSIVGNDLTILNGNTVTLPIPSGSLNLNGQTGIIQSFVNDSNVTITSAGDVHTLGWAGILPISRGGTNSAAAPVAGGVAYGDGSSYQFTIAGTAGQVLTSNGFGVPTWQNVSPTGVSTVTPGAGLVGSLPLGPGAITLDVQAQNGLSVNSDFIELGGALGSAGAAQLLSNREIPLNGFDINFSVSGTPRSQIEDDGSVRSFMDYNLVGDFIQSTTNLGIQGNNMRLTTNQLNFVTPAISSAAQATVWNSGAQNLTFTSAAGNNFFLRAGTTGSNHGSYEFTASTGGSATQSRRGISLVYNAGTIVNSISEIGLNVLMNDSRAALTGDVIGSRIDVTGGTNISSTRIGSIIINNENNEFIRLSDSTNADSASIFTGNQNPETVVAAQIGSLFLDNANGIAYLKSSNDAANTGWTPLAAGASVSSITPGAGLNGSLPLGPGAVTLDVTAQNGIAIVSDAVELGGTLLHNTDIAQAGFNFTTSGLGSVGLGTATPGARVDAGGNTFSLGGTTSVFQVSNNLGNYASVQNGGSIRFNDFNNGAGADSPVQDFTGYFRNYSFNSPRNAVNSAGLPMFHLTNNLVTNSAPYLRAGLNINNTDPFTVFAVGLNRFGVAQQESPTAMRVTDNYGALNVNSVTNMTKTGMNIILSGAYTNAGTGLGITRGLFVDVSGGEVNQSAIFMGGNVGIANSMPNDRLVVGDGTSGIQRIAIDSGTQSHLILQRAGVNQWGISSNDSVIGRFALYDYGGAGEVLTAASGTGNVGVGTAPGIYKMTVRGSGSLGLQLTDAGSDSIFLQGGVLGNTFTSRNNSLSVHHLNSINGARLALAADSGGTTTKETFTITTSGNVGIGSEPGGAGFAVGPAATLDLQTRDNNSNLLRNLIMTRYDANSVASAGIGTGMLFRLEGDNSNVANAGAIDVFLDDASDLSPNSSMIFSTTIDGVFGERMRISDVGNVGIGNNNPTDRLYVGDGTSSIQRIAIDTGLQGHVLFKQGGVNQWGISTNDSLAGLFSIYDYSGGGDALSIEAGGFVGIGNTNPGVRFHVGSSTIPIATTVARFENAGGTCDVTPNIAGGITCTSDERFKTNIQDFSGALNLINQIDVKSYNLINGGTYQVGVIAQGLEQILPDLVMTNEEGYKSVSYSGLTPYLIAAVQEQQNLVDGVDAKVEDVQSQIASIIAEDNSSALQMSLEDLQNAYSNIQVDIDSLKQADIQASEQLSQMQSTIDLLQSQINSLTNPDEIVTAQVLSAISGAEIVSLNVVDAQFTGNVTVASLNVTNLRVLGTAQVSADISSQATVAAGLTEVEVTFSSAYVSTPNVTVSPIGEFALDSDFNYTILEKSNSGFKIKTNKIYPFDIKFDWIVLSN